MKSRTRVWATVVFEGISWGARTALTTPRLSMEQFLDRSQGIPSLTSRVATVDRFGGQVDVAVEHALEPLAPVHHVVAGALLLDPRRLRHPSPLAFSPSRRVLQRRPPGCRRQARLP